jgi:hypothetical protein
MSDKEWVVGSLIRSINWYLRSKKEYDEDAFNKWASNKVNKKRVDDYMDFDEGFKFSSIDQYIENYLVKAESKKTLSTHDVYFISHFMDLNSDIFMFNEKLLELKDLVSNIIPSSVENKNLCDLLNSFTLNTTIPIEPLTGEKSEIEEWFDKYERLSKGYNWNEKTMGLKLSTVVSGNALLAWSNMAKTAQYDYEAAC